MFRSGGFWVLALFVVIVTGCGTDGFTSFSDHPVKGRILLPDGKPLGSGRVVFVSSATALSYGGSIGSNGDFELKQGSRVGAPEGEYRVRIEIDETRLPKRRGNSPRLPFPAKFLDEDASRLAAKVQASGDNTFEFKLTR
jgi:hypothetical protein